MKYRRTTSQFAAYNLHLEDNPLRRLCGLIVIVIDFQMVYLKTQIPSRLIQIPSKQFYMDGGIRKFLQSEAS